LRRGNLLHIQGGKRLHVWPQNSQTAKNDSPIDGRVVFCLFGG